MVLTEWTRIRARVSKIRKRGAVGVAAMPAEDVNNG
jgi:hypothetical protein